MNVLEKIVTDKKVEVANLQQSIPSYAIEPGLQPSSRSFYEALKQDYEEKGSSFILEVKKASPSKGLIRPNFDLEEICDAYKDHATCISVLTDKPYFQGDFERIPKVRELLHQPILCKDFFIDTYQVKLARFYGADAVLLMLSVLDDATYLQLAAVANELQLDILTEVSNSEEMARAVKLNARIIGINNRNLRDLTTDLSQTVTLKKVFNELTDDHQKQNTILISESGIYRHQQVNQLKSEVHGFLVGSSLMAQKNIKAATKSLTQGEHKVCGLTKAEDVIRSFESGAYYGGLIFAAQSPRKLTKPQAQDLLDNISHIVDKTGDQDGIKLVGVFQSEPIDSIIEILLSIPFYAIQLHGNEDAEYIAQLQQALSDIAKDTDKRKPQIWKATSVDNLNQLVSSGLNVDKYVVDAVAKDGMSGGTGTRFDWRKLSYFKDQFDLPDLLLAGGLTPENINDAFSLPVSGFDINSGIEVSPGVKDKQKMKTIFDQILNTKEKERRM